MVKVQTKTSNKTGGDLHGSHEEKTESKSQADKRQGRQGQNALLTLQAAFNSTMITPRPASNPKDAGGSFISKN